MEWVLAALCVPVPHGLCLCLLQRTSPEGGIHLNCHYCHNLFSGKPEILDWQVRTFLRRMLRRTPLRAPSSPSSNQNSSCTAALNALTAVMSLETVP